MDHYGHDAFFDKVYGRTGGDYYSDLNMIVYDNASGSMVNVGNLKQAQDYGLVIGGIGAGTTPAAPALIPSHVFASAAEQNAFYAGFANLTPAQQQTALATYTLPPPPPVPAAANLPPVTSPVSNGTSNAYGTGSPGEPVAPSGFSALTASRPWLKYAPAAILALLLIRGR